MRLLNRSILALLSLWVACHETGDGEIAEAPVLNMIQLALTLPNGAALDELGYTVSNTSYQRTGTVHIHGTSSLRILIGSLPAANGYALALSATTLAGEDCSGLSQFDIANIDVTPVAVSLTCGARVQPVDTAGDVALNADVNSAEPLSCPVVTGISVTPRQVDVGASITLEGFTSSPAPSRWTTAPNGLGPTAGVIADLDATATTLVCELPGQYWVTLRTSRPGCEPRFQSETIDCTRALCGNGSLDPGEECDDGNGSSGDACSSACLREPICAVDFPCFQRTAQCVGPTKIQATRTFDCEEVCGTPLCSGGGCGGTGPLLDCPAGQVCVDAKIGDGPFDSSARCLPSECNGVVCPDDFGLCNFQLPTPPECIAACAAGGCCADVGGGDWFRVALDCSPDAGS